VGSSIRVRASAVARFDSSVAKLDPLSLAAGEGGAG